MTCFLLLSNSSYLSAQPSGGLDVLKDDIVSLLPPLATLIDSAIKNNFNVKFRDLQIDVNKTKLHTQQSVWAKNMGLQSDIRYGTFDNFSTNTAEGQNPSVLATRNSQTNYGVGAYIKFPLYDLIDRKNLINMAKAEVDQAVSMAEAQRNELRQTVIKQYNDLILKQRLLKIRSKYFITSKINMEMVEKEFHNGVISVTEYARLSEISATAEANYESARVDFNTAFQIMEEIVGYKFNLTETKKNTNEHH